jgi:thiosulfate/3-mercaptopyruvate sulfurtransferase
VATSFSPIVDTDWLRRHHDHAVLRLVDSRWYLDDPGRAHAEYLTAHIRGAQFVSLDDLSAPEGPGRHPLPATRQFARLLGERGIGPENVVVVYDAQGGAYAARLWWMLSALGHRTVAVLDGGIDAWAATGGELDAAVPVYSPTEYGPVPDAWPGTTDRVAVAARAVESVLVDARAPERFRGEREPIDPVAGHIPGAVNVPHLDNLTEDGTLRSPEELRARYAAAGITDAVDSIVYCGSGVTSCQTILAMEIAGIGRSVLYPGSWSDWSSAGGAVETG